MLSKLDNDLDTQIRMLRRQYLSPSEAEGAIRKVIDAQLENAPLCVFDTTTGCLCDREARICAFNTSTKYKELLSFAMMHADRQMDHIEEMVAMYFSCVMLSHRWEGREPLLHDIHDKVVYSLSPASGITKLQSFCKIVRDAGYRWAWSDTCCIDKINNVELQESLNSMFVWYRHSALTIVYLSDVPPSSKPGALAESAWTTRGWTVGEFLAPKTPYLDYHSPNHKESIAIVQELEGATGIDPGAIVAFRPGMAGAREKLRWASTRVTTLQEDIAYSLFGIFGITLPVIYGEKKHNALGRLLQEVIAQSGDISALDWVGKSSEFNSCLPANITSYKAPPSTLPSLSDGEMQTSVSSLRDAGAGEPASKLYSILDYMSAPRFANRRLHLPCIAFPVTEIRQRSDHNQETQFTYGVKAAGLHDLLITTEDKLAQFSLAKRSRRSFLLVRPWNRNLLEMSDVVDDTESEEYRSAVGSPAHDSFSESSEENEPVHSESHSRALQLVVRLGQPFGAFLLAQRQGKEYMRIASDRDIIAQVRDMTSVHTMMDVRTLEIL
ncbi:hypothetical protein DFH29DRAFT_1067888 [Suillus ampliporus]|nr:hypothetical protein DFH29DRAFT_1067888 [Suillus ampliporus]